MERNRIKKIAVIGAESTGKTWLCEQLAAHFSTAWVPEYAREYFNDSDIYNYSLGDLEIIAEQQLLLEEECMHAANTYLFCDTAMITLKIWADLEFGKPSKRLQALIDKGFYDLYLICDNSVPWQADPQRLNKFSRELIFELNQKEAMATRSAFAIISGSGESRLQQAIRACS